MMYRLFFLKRGIRRPVSNRNNQYMTFSPMWKFCRDVISGSDAVKAGGELYLPKPSGMKENDYKGYLTRGEFSPYTGRTHEGIHGLIFMKALMKTIPDQLLQYLDNVNGEGTDLDTFVNDVTFDCSITSWGGILVDAPQSEDMSLGEAEIKGLFPYMTYYPAESIINVDYKVSNRNKDVSLVVLVENIMKAGIDKFSKVPTIQYRVLEIEEETGLYKQSLYNDKEEEIYSVYPMKMGKPMTYIPFYFLPNREPTIPMMKNLADVNIAWYRKSADLENGAHWTGVPTPYSRGFTPATETDEEGNPKPTIPLKLGGSEFVWFPQGVEEVGYLEFSGSGCGLLREMMLDDENRMAILGARIIASEKKGVESAETAMIHRAGENSVLAAFANKISESVTRAVREYLEWTIAKEIEDPIEIHLNTDYNTQDMNPQELTALVSLWQSGGISKRTLFANLQSGEIIPADKSFEDEQQEIDEEGMMKPPVFNEEETEEEKKKEEEEEK